MGKSNHKKYRNITSNSSEKKAQKGPLSPQKRNEVNEILKKVLKLTSQVQTDIKTKWSNYMKIDTLLCKVKEIEPAFDTEKKRETHFPSLLNWFKENGGVTGSVTISEFDNMEYGLEAVKDINEGELICAVPRQIMMTLDNIEDSPLKYLFKNDPILKNMGNIALALFLILEYIKGTSSFWYSYICSLPTQYSTVLYFTLDDFLLLKCSPTFEPGVNHCLSIARQYAYFNNLFQSSNDEGSKILRDAFTYELYRWAVSTVMTRQNFLPSKDDSLINGLIPLWDMCNHADGYLSTQYAADRSESLACRSFKKGEQVLIYYGERSNENFFIHNGFTYEGNNNDSYRFFLGVSKGDKLHDERCELLKRLEIPVSGDFHIYSGAEPVRGQLLAFSRIFNMEADDLNRWKSTNRLKDLTWKECSLDTKLETKVWNFLYNRIKLLLMGYKDVFEIDKDPETACRRLVRKQLLLEKKFLEIALEQIRQQIKT